MDEPLIEVEGLETHYGETRVLHDVSLTVPRGGVFVIIGGSGCGKTTLLKHIAGLLRPTKGSIRINGEDITQMSEDDIVIVQQGIGIAFQSGGLFNSLSVGENVALPIREYGGIHDNALIDAMVRIRLNMVGLGQAVSLMPSELSGGMRKRAGLARAMALDPPLVLFDEPSAGLDPIMAAGLDELILDLKNQLGITFVIVTHELESIRKIADQLVMLDQGKVLFMGSVAEAEQCEVDRVRQFFAREADTHIIQRDF